ADGSSKNYNIFSEMLDDFDRQDVMDIQILVEERYTTTSPEGLSGGIRAMGLSIWDSTSSKPTRKKTLARKRAGGNDSQESVKKQKLEDDTEKKELKAYLDIVPEDEFVMEVKSLATNEMLDDFGRQDVMDLHRLIKKIAIDIIRGLTGLQENSRTMFLPLSRLLGETKWNKIGG
nr:hypothetical protein [Tanacetum cinerariifolium]